MSGRVGKQRRAPHYCIPHLAQALSFDGCNFCKWISTIKYLFSSRTKETDGEGMRGVGNGK